MYMSNERISQLPIAITTSGNDLYTLVQGGINKSITYALLAATIGGGSGGTESVQYFTLLDSDIVNQYVTLTHTPLSTSVLVSAGGVVQFNTDFDVSGNKILFQGDLASGGEISLAAGDMLVIGYAYIG
jgi:hypothetical protein